MDAKQRFGIRLKRLRSESNLTQIQLGLMVGLSSKYVSNLESGRGNPTLTLLVKISRGLGVSVSELIDGVDEMSD